MKKVNVKKVFGSELKELMRLLSSSGKECYIVGGAIRDLLLGYKKFKDIDGNKKPDFLSFLRGDGATIYGI